MPRLVRRKPLSERLKAYLNPLDFLLYVSEELETSEWDTASFGRALGMGLNFALLLARANSGGGGREDDVFGDGGGSNWVGWLVSLLLLFTDVEKVGMGGKRREGRGGEMDE